MSAKARLATITLLTASLAGLGAMPASAAPAKPISISDADSAWLSANGVSVSTDSQQIMLTSAAPAPTVVVWGIGAITEKGTFTGPATGSVIAAHGNYQWASEVGGISSAYLSADAHTSYRLGGVSGEDYTVIADRMTEVIAPEIYAGRDGIGHDASTLSDCTVNICGVWVSPVVLEQDVNGDDVLRTTDGARWVQVDQDGSAWENSTGITWDASTGRGTRLEGNVVEGYRAQSSGTLSTAWLAPNRPSLPAPSTSTVNPDGTVSVGISGGGVAARRGHVALNLGYEGGQTVDPGAPAEPPVAPPVTPQPETTPAPEPTPTPEVSAPVLRFETGAFTAEPVEGTPWSNLALLVGAGGLVIAMFAVITRPRAKKVAAKKK